MRVAIGIATRGRPAILAEVLRELRQQTRQPDRIIVCHVAPEDIGERQPGVEYLTAPAGLPRQRNAIMAECGDCDAVLFLDDDFLAAPAYLAATEAGFEAWPDVVVTTGTVLADGARGPGLSVAEGRAVLARDAYAGAWLEAQPHFNGYGCNMAVRLSVVREHGIRVDEALPAYAWYEDIDFTRALGRHGRIIRLAAARGVHLGVKVGRTPGLRLGYSQVANSIYLARKGTYPWDHALRSVARHCALNLARSPWPEPWADRWGRFKGNMLAFLDLARGRMSPGRINEL
ncbi:glycosyltransferase family 2 protein [Siccirubricoccus sp. KC 17139]|uniref:Glycosyltransferase family 2 protein n=1 Tax=Siccirubricoccus soli TaxID=2899147 RepID=A0ABT1D7C7_9PROT|nr:glycosyltransferase family 2 protein [Siccirubricoccus soli]MCO6417853.1 glycosyltransferase family 2 protein [Siccirubricoccus soli]MCP2683988.1 glycosyltransferase family 2 protein [Siccirubricoccus soli]